MTNTAHWGHFWVMSSASQVQTWTTPSSRTTVTSCKSSLKSHLWLHWKKPTAPLLLKTIRNSRKSLHETSVFWDSLFRASPYTLSWHIIPQIHLKPVAEAVYKDSITITCRKLSSQLSTSPLNGCQRKSSRLLPSSSHLQQLGVSTWKQALSEADTPYRGMHFQAQSKGLPTAPPSRLSLGKTIPKWSYSFVV